MITTYAEEEFELDTCRFCGAQVAEIVLWVFDGGSFIFCCRECVGRLQSRRL